MRVAMLSLHSSPLGRLGTRDTGGMSVYVRELSRCLGRKGHQVDIFTARSGRADGALTGLGEGVRLVHLRPETAAAAADDPVTHHDVGELSSRLLDWSRNDSRGYDLIHSNYWLSALVGERLGRQWGVPHLVTYHTLAALKQEAGGPPEPAVRLEQEQRLAQSCQGVLAPTAREKRRVVQLQDGRGGPVHVIPCGVDLEHFRPAAPRAPAAGATPVAPGGKLLFVGRFDPMKGAGDLVRSLALLEHDPVELLLVGGDGPESETRQRLVRLARQLGVAGRLHFHGCVEHRRMPRLYTDAGAVVVSSRYESFGLVILEALACGTPVAATAVGVAPQVIEPGINGFMAEPGDTRGLATAMAGALELSRGDKRDLIRGTVGEYDWHRVTADLISVYQDTVANYMTDIRDTIS